MLFVGCGNKAITNEKTIQPTTKEKSVINETNQGKFTATMTEVFKKWGKATCTILVNNTTWTYYINGKNMELIFKSAAGGMNIEMHNLTKDGYNYTRTSMSKEGRKTKSMLDKNDGETWTNAVASAIDNTPVEFDCKKWIDSTVTFDVPSDITFKDTN